LPRLNPFVLPGVVDTRFWLLAVGTVCASLLIFTGIQNEVRTFTLSPAADARCRQTALATPPAAAGLPGRASSPVSRAYGMNDAQLAAYLSCLGVDAGHLTAGDLAGVAALVLCATAMWWFYPAWKIWRRRLRPIAADQFPELTTYLGQLTEKAGLRRRPALLWNPAEPAA